MVVVEAKIQTVEDIYRLVWMAVATKRPISAIFKGLPRLFCPHRLGRNRAEQLRVLCYQCGGESESGFVPDGLARELALRSSGETAEGQTAAWFLADCTESFPPGTLYRPG